MTIDTFMGRLRMSGNIKKSEKNFTLEDGTVLPMYAIEEVWGEFGSNWVSYYAYEPENHNYFHSMLLDEYAHFARWMMSYQPRQLHKLLDSGELYEYITESVSRALELVETQTEHWTEKDRECRLAKMNGDTETYDKLRRNLRLIAEDAILKTVLYRV